MTTNVQEDEPRVDGQGLLPLTEPGSDAQLSERVRERIAQVVRDWVEARGQDGDMSDQTTDPPERPEDDRERERVERERGGEREEDDRKRDDESAGDDPDTASTA